MSPGGRGPNGSPSDEFTAEVVDPLPPGKQPIACEECGGKCWKSSMPPADGRALCRGCRGIARRTGCGTVSSYKRGCRCTECRGANRVALQAHRDSRKARGLLAQKRRADREYQSREGVYPDCVVCGLAVTNGYVRSDSPTHNACKPAGRQIAISRRNRWAIYERDGRVCQLCDGPVDLSLAPSDRWSPTLDHIVPYSRGGSDEESNLRLAHRSCNSRRGAPAIEAAA